MQPDDLTAVASARLDAPAEVVWDALLNPEVLRQIMFGATVRSDWHEGHPITWKGVWQGRAYEDKGVILKLRPLRLLQYSSFSSLSGLPDRPEHYHTITMELREEGHHTLLSIKQDKNPTREARVHAEKNWESMLSSLKKLLESSHHNHVAGP